MLDRVLKVCGGDSNQALFFDLVRYFKEALPPCENTVYEAFANITIALTSPTILNELLAELEKEVKSAWEQENETRPLENKLTLLTDNDIEDYIVVEDSPYPWLTQEYRGKLNQIHFNGILGSVLHYDEKEHKFNLGTENFSGKRPVPEFVGIVASNIIKELIKQGYIFNERAKMYAIVIHSKEMHRVQLYLIRRGVTKKLIDIGDLSFQDINNLLMTSLKDSPNTVLWDLILDNNFSKPRVIREGFFHPLYNPKKSICPSLFDTSLAGILKQKKAIAEKNFPEGEFVNGISAIALYSYLMMADHLPHLQTISTVSFNKAICGINQDANFLRYDTVKIGNKFISQPIYPFWESYPLEWTKRQMVECLGRQPITPPYFHLLRVLSEKTNKPLADLLQLTPPQIESSYKQILQEMLFPNTAEETLQALRNHPAEESDYSPVASGGKPIHFVKCAPIMWKKAYKSFTPRENCHTESSKYTGDHSLRSG